MSTSSTSTTLHKKISLFSATALSATAMIGSGWLFSAQLNAQLAGNYAFLGWFLAALAVMLVGLCLAEVVAVYPVRGATTRSSALSHNAIFGMPFAFANWFGLMVSVATEAQATTQYLASCIKQWHLVEGDGLTVEGKLFSLAILFFYLVVNFYGVKLLARVNNVVTVLKIGTPFFVIGTLLIAHFDKSNFYLPSGLGYHPSAAISAIVGAGLIYSYNGFQLAVAFASEVKNPRKNVPLSIVISITFMMLIYMALQLAFMGGVPHAMLDHGWASLNFHSPLLDVALILGLHFLVLLLMADSVVSPTGTGYAYLGGASRMFYAMAAEGQMPKWSAGKLNPIYNICRRSLLINWLMIAILLWNSHGWASLMVIVTGYNVIGYMAAPVSMGAIKPHKRFFGAIVFIMIGYIMTSMPQHDLVLVTLSIIILMFVYGGAQLSYKKSLYDILMMTTPFVLYLWALCFFHQTVWSAIASLLFYLIITDKRFVAFCKEHQETEVDLHEEAFLPH